MNSRIIFTIAALALFTYSAGCGGDDLDLNGDWKFSQTFTSDECDLVTLGLPEEYNLAIEQSGQRVAVILAFNTSLRGTLDGSSFEVSGTVPSFDFCSSTSVVSMSGRASETHISGTLQTTYTPSLVTCAAGSQCSVRGNFTMDRL